MFSGVKYIYNGKKWRKVGITQLICGNPKNKNSKNINQNKKRISLFLIKNSPNSPNSQ